MTSAIVDRLLGCLAELDAKGKNIAAAHVDAAIHELVRDTKRAPLTTELNVNQAK